MAEISAFSRSSLSLLALFSPISVNGGLRVPSSAFSAWRTSMKVVDSWAVSVMANPIRTQASSCFMQVRNEGLSGFATHFS